MDSSYSFSRIENTPLNEEVYKMELDFILDLFSRYLLVGIILWGIWFIMLIIRMFYISFKLYGNCKLIDSFNSGTKEGATKGNRHLLVEVLFWPYWVIRASREYFEEEEDAIRRIG